jgi:hypothetical protein
MPRGRAKNIVNGARFGATSRMLVMMVWSEGSAREEAAAAYAATVSAITGGVVGLKRKQRRGESRPLTRGYETTALAVGRKHAAGAATAPARNPLGDASPVQQRDAVPQKWDAHEPAVLVQVASLQEVVHRINEWCPTLPVVIIGHRTMDLTAVTHPNAMLYLCEDDSAECLVEASEATAVGAAWAQSDADLSDVIGVMLVPPSASRRFRVGPVRGSGDTSALNATRHPDDAPPVPPADILKATCRKAVLDNVPAAALGSVFDYLRSGTDVHALRMARRHLVEAFDAAIDNESPTMNGVSWQVARGATWRWCPLYRIPQGNRKARKVYMAKRLLDDPASHTLQCATVIVRATSFNWEAGFEKFRDIREIEVRGKMCKSCRYLDVDETICEASVHTILPLWLGQVLLLHGRTSVEGADRRSSIHYLCSLLHHHDSLGLRFQGTVDAGVVTVAEHCTFLRRLDLSNTDVTDAGIVLVAKHCTRLEYVNVVNTSVTNVAISAMASSLPLLNSLYINHTRVTHVDLDLGKGCPLMIHFSASFTDFSALEPALPYWPRLNSLHLCSMVPTATLFAALGRHNRRLYWVRLEEEASAEFRAPRSYMMDRPGLWRRR